MCLINFMMALSPFLQPITIARLSDDVSYCRESHELFDQFDPKPTSETQRTMHPTPQICVTALVAAFAVCRPNVLPADDLSKETAYPISHVVVIFQENVSFDHYFATYPFALNPAGEPAFHAKKDTPSANGLSDSLLTNNPNSLQPVRIDRSHAATADQDHNYTDEQKAFDHGLMDKFVEFTGTPEGGGPSLVMDYFDGNTVTALWNYAQRYAMNDNSYGTTFAHQPLVP
jgi:phospholipase C